MSSASRIAQACALALLLTACDQSARSSASSLAVPHVVTGFDEAVVATAIKTRLERRLIYSPLGNSPCGSEFIISQPTITARHIQGDQGQVEATMLITARRELPERSDPTFMCFGAPAGGFAAGQSMSYTRTYPVERWDTGWRLGAGQ